MLGAQWGISIIPISPFFPWTKMRDGVSSSSYRFLPNFFLVRKKMIQNNLNWLMFWVIFLGSTLNKIELQFLPGRSSIISEIWTKIEQILVSTNQKGNYIISGPKCQVILPGQFVWFAWMEHWKKNNNKWRS